MTAEKKELTAQERFDALPDHFVPVEAEPIIKDWLKGKLAAVNHPITPLNPSEYFTIVDVKIEENGKIFVRGEHTMWFGESMVKIDVLGF